MSDTSPSPPQDDWPWISVVITTYDLSRYDDFCECVDSVISQTYDNHEIILVTETQEVLNAVTRDYSDASRVTIEHLTEGENLATARNAGAKVADGDVVAFIDDDAVAVPEWLSEIARGYRESECAAVGGRADPVWIDCDGWYLPSEFYWLVGSTYNGFKETEGEVRNTFGCNISFKRDVFLDLGGFDSSLGKDHGHNLQGEETDLCARLREETGNGLYYVPDAKVSHKVYPEQMSLRWLFDRAFWQGVTKAVIDDGPDDSTDEEWGFLAWLLLKAIPAHSRSALLLDSRSIVQLVLCISFIGVVGLGFLSGKLRIVP